MLNFKSPQSKSIMAASATFAAGFGMMNLFWLSRKYPPEVPGLYSYRSATWGDGLLLPSLAASLTYAACETKMPEIAKILVPVAGIAGFATGAGTQIAWLKDKNPNINWSLPEPGVFNAAGWYHAAFLSGGAAFFSAMAMRAGLGTLMDSNRKAARAMVGVGLSATGFASLVYWDGLKEKGSASNRSTNKALAAIVGVVATGAALILGKAHLKTSS